MADTPKVRARRSNQIDKHTEAMIFQGCTQSQLVMIFKMDRRDIAQRIMHAQIDPCGERGGFPIYQISDVAPYLVKPRHSAAKIEEYLKKMNPADLPKVLAKEFWAGQRSRQEFLIREGDLWDTDQVMQVFSEAFKNIRQSALLFRDALDKQHMLTEAQSKFLEGLTDGLLHDMADRLQKVFGERMAAHGSKMARIAEEAAQMAGDNVDAEAVHGQEAEEDDEL